MTSTGSERLPRPRASRTSGDVLYGWDTQGEADWWQTPFQVVVPDGKPQPITMFSGKDEPLAVSNGTTAVDPGRARGRFHDTGGRRRPEDRIACSTPATSPADSTAGRSATATTRAGTKLDGLGMDMALAWGPDGSIVVADVTHADRAATITTVLPEAPGTSLTPAFSVPAGDYWRALRGLPGRVRPARPGCRAHG